MWSAIFGVLASLPKFLDLAEKFVAWMSQQITDLKNKKAVDDLNKAVDEAKKDKDTSKLDDLFNPGGKK